jgi:branched-chain amino acid transport system ATP-binding protein
MSETVLRVENVTVRFGGITALSDVGFAVTQGEFVGLIGPNGAGKTTLFRSIMGSVKPTQGRIILNEADITTMKSAQRSRLGLAISHQIVRPFRNMTLLDNVALAVGRNITRSPLISMLHLSRSAQRKLATEYLDRVSIAHLKDMLPGSQPLGVLKRLEVARALALDPSLLLLDEPLAGLGHGEAGPIAALLVDLNASGVTILLIEHNMVEARRVCSRFVVLDNGAKIADGPTAAVLADSKVIAAYLGEGWKDA